MVKLLTGSTGMIGSNLKELLPGLLCPTHSELDLTNSDQVKDYLFHNKPEVIINCASNDDDVCLYDNLRMFYNLAEYATRNSTQLITFCTGREIEDRAYKNGEYVFSKHLVRELSLNCYSNVTVIKIWGCFGKYEKPIRFFADNMKRVKEGLPIKVQENKLFSYVYVNDLAKIINKISSNMGDMEIVGYTHSLLDYAKILKKVTGSKEKIIVGENNFYHSYVGKNNTDFKFTPLEKALREYWNATK